MKTGRLSKTEWDFIDRNAELMTADQIAKALDRDLAPVQTYLRKIGKSLHKKEDFEAHAQYDLQSRPYWVELQSQFSERELELFVYHWAQYVTQFKFDVMATEEMQVVDLVKLEVLMNRALTEQRNCSLKIGEIQEELEELKHISKNSMMGPEEMVQHREYTYSLEKQVSLLGMAKETLIKEFKDFQDKKSKLFKDLKATRDQRFDFIESNKQTFASLVTKLMKDPAFSEKCSLEMVKMAEAIKVERARLSQFHQFGNSVDRCLVTSETVTDEDRA